MWLLNLFKKKPISKETDVRDSKPLAELPRNSNTDYANAVFLYYHRNKACSMDSMSHLGWPSYKLGIHDTTKKFQSLLNEGYFVEAPIQEQLGKLKVEELKTIITTNGLNAKGKKSDLISIMIESVPIEKLNLKKLYKLSSKGLDYIESHQDLILLFKNPYNITYDEYLKVKKSSPPYLKYNDIIWSVFNRRELEFSATDNFSRQINALHRAEFLVTEKKYDFALVFYLVNIYYDINQTIMSYSFMSDEKRRELELSPPDYTLAQHLVDKVASLADYFEKDMIQKSISLTNIGKKYISDSDFKRYINDIFTRNEADYSKYVKAK